jgi:hypothetical protein
MMEKRVNKNLVVFGGLLLISLSLIFAVVLVHEGSSTIQINEDLTQNYSVVVNNSDNSGNITQVNITLPSTFTFLAGENETDAPINGSMFSNLTLSGGSHVLSWTNGTGGIGAGYLINGSSNGTYFSFNATAATAGDYNFTVLIINSSNASEVPVEANISVIINDTTIPGVATPVSPIANGNYSGVLVINVSVIDDTILTKGGSVIFNLTNSSGTGGNTSAINYTGLKESTSGTSGYWSIEINTTDFDDGIYNLTIWANDSNNQINSTTMVQQVRFDNTAPSSVTLTTRNSSRTSLEVSISITESASSVNGTCTVDRSGATVGGSGANQWLEETGLTCNTAYSYVVTCKDTAGNSASSVSTSFTTSHCSSSLLGGSSSSSLTWSNTFVIQDESVFASEEGYNNQLRQKERIKVTIFGATHHIGVKSVSDNSAIIEIASDPVEVSLNVGGEARVDVDEDGVYDLYVKLNSITGGEADLTIKLIEELVVSGEGEEGSSVDVSDGEIVGEVENEEGESGFGTIGIIIIIILVLAALIGAGVGINKSRK